MVIIMIIEKEKSIVLTTSRVSGQRVVQGFLGDLSLLSIYTIFGGASLGVCPSKHHNFEQS